MSKLESFVPVIVIMVIIIICLDFVNSSIEAVENEIHNMAVRIDRNNCSK